VSWLTAALEWQSRAVVARHLRVYMRNWYTAFLPPAFEPVTMLLAFGVGLGGYVASMTWQGRPIEYMSYVAPGLLAYGMLIECIQWLLPWRQFSLGDWAADAAGVLLACILLHRKTPALDTPARSR